MIKIVKTSGLLWWSTVTKTPCSQYRGLKFDP